MDAETVRRFRDEHQIGLIEARAILHRREIEAALRDAETSGDVPEPVLRWMRMMTPGPSHTERHLSARVAK